MKKRSLLMAASLVLALLVATTGTLAYLSDTDSDVNVMTLGNVQIEQVEMQRVVENNAWVSTGEVDKYGYTPDKLEAFANDKPLYPAYFADDKIKWDDRVDNHQQSWGQVGAPGANQLFDDSVKGAQDKFVFVKNTGASDAYVRTWFAFEQGSVTAERFEAIVGTNGDADHWKWETVASDVDIDGNKYVIACATYLGPTSNPNGILAAGETTYPSLLQVYLAPEATNEDVVAIDGNGNGLYEILVFSEAVQTTNFPNAEKALNTAFYAPAADAHPWVKHDDVEGMPIKSAATADELIAALAEGGTVVFTDDIAIKPASMSNAYGTTGINVTTGQTIDGNGHTLNISGAGGTWDSGINTTGGVIRNITVTGSFRGIFINHNSTHSEKVVLENVTIKGTTYTISCDQGMNQGLEATNSTFNGWTSYAATLGEAKFVNCSFGAGNGYAYCRPYAPTEFVGCEFETGYTVDPRAAVTFENCTIGGVALTAENVGELVTNTAKVTVK